MKPLISISEYQIGRVLNGKNNLNIKFNIDIFNYTKDPKYTLYLTGEIVRKELENHAININQGNMLPEQQKLNDKCDQIV
jgi:hypothetical protein